MILDPAAADTQPVDIMEIPLELPKKKEHTFGADQKRQAEQAWHVNVGKRLLVKHIIHELRM